MDLYEVINELKDHIGGRLSGWSGVETNVKSIKLVDSDNNNGFKIVIETYDK